MDSCFTGLDDESLISQIQEGSDDAFSELVYRHTNRFYAIAYRILSNKGDAEDIVQEAFIKLWDKPQVINIPAASGRSINYCHSRDLLIGNPEFGKPGFRLNRLPE